MKIDVIKYTDEHLLHRAAQFTCGHSNFKAQLSKWYDCEHSPIRTQMFAVEMFDIPTSASVHLVRHKVGVEHFVRSNREDRGGNKKADRDTLINHMMFLNAQALITMSRRRLCSKAEKPTRELWENVKFAVSKVDSDLALAMVPECEYRGRCTEFKSCGRYDGLYS